MGNFFTWACADFYFLFDGWILRVYLGKIWFWNFHVRFKWGMLNLVSICSFLEFGHYDFGLLNLVLLNLVPCTCAPDLSSHEFVPLILVPMNLVLWFYFHLRLSERHNCPSDGFTPDRWTFWVPIHKLIMYKIHEIFSIYGTLIHYKTTHTLF